MREVRTARVLESVQAGQVPLPFSASLPFICKIELIIKNPTLPPFKGCREDQL